MKPIILVLFVVACAAVAPEDGESSYRSARSIQAKNICLAELNSKVSHFGRSLTANAKLEAAARKHNELMKARRCLGNCPGEPDYQARVRNEGYQWGSSLMELVSIDSATTCQQVVDGWFGNSPWNSLVIAGIKEIGCHQSGNYFTCLFANP